MVGPCELLNTAQALSFILSDLYSGAKGEVRTALEKWNVTNNINSLYKKISDVRNVKTIWKVDKTINLKSFYYPSKLIVNEKRTTINAVKKIVSDKNILIEGTVGQGKSIFLRYLCSQELSINERIPVFLQLRKIQEGQSLKDNLCEVLDSWHFNINEQLFDYLASTGKLLLLLDGFDEIKEGMEDSIIKEIEYFSEKYQQMKIVVTSRPNRGLENSAYFDVFDLLPLNDEDHGPFLTKLISDKTEVSALLSAIEENGANIRGLIRTPLMMTLLVFVYQSEQKIPEQMSEFYEHLFPLLFYRHDKTKPGFKRKRNCNLNERDIQKAFEALCYITKKNKAIEFSRDDLLGFSAEALKVQRLKCDPGGFVDDISKVSCLIVEEGFRYYFLHKSVQEYFTCSFIKNRNEEFAKIFYTKIRELYSHWQQELNFLSQIDQYRFSRYFLIPDIEHSLNFIFGESIDVNVIDEDVAKKLFSEVSISVSDEGICNGYTYKRRGLLLDKFLAKVLTPFIRDELLTSSFVDKYQNLSKSDIEPSMFKSILAVSLLEDPELHSVILEWLKSEVESALHQLELAKKCLAMEDEMHSMLP